MVAAVVAGLAVGVPFGALMARGGVCFNTGMRQAVFDRRPLILRVFAVAVAAQLLVLPVVVALGVPVSRIGLYPVAQVIGGLVFGCGIALAGGCIAGVLWKSGAGSIATAIAIAGFGVGELVMRGPWSDVLREFDAAGPRPGTTTVHGALDLSYALAAVPLGIVGLVLLLRRDRSGARLGLALGGLAVLAWVAADWADYGYGLGFVGTAENVRDAFAAREWARLSLEPFLALGVVLGAACAMRGRLRLPDRARAVRALGGGVLMGVGGNLAHGCNIGNGLTGVPLLSLGSMLATGAMALGAAATWRLAIRDHPRIAGSERPSTDLS